MTPSARSRPTILLVDDEERILRSLAMLFRLQYEVRMTTDPHEALSIVGRERVHVVVSDQKMPLMRGADLLKAIKDSSPNSMRLLLTGYSELDAVVASVNEGEIFRYLSKPWDAAEVRDCVAQAAQIAMASFAVPTPAEVPSAAAGPQPPLELIALTPRAVAAPLLAAERILVIDDAEEVVNSVREAKGASHPVLWARSLDEAFEQLAQEPVAVVVSELEVRGQHVTGLLKALKARHPEVVTLVMTPFQDIGTLVGLINEGQVYRLLPKPVRQGPLAAALTSALRQHSLLKNSPLLAARHTVAPIAAAEEQTIASRVLGFLGRLRSRSGLPA